MSEEEKIVDMKFYVPQGGWYWIGEYEYFIEEIPEDGLKLVLNPETFQVEPENFKMKRKR